MTGLTRDRLLAVLRYEPETGKLFWLGNDRVEAGTRTARGYRRLRVDGRDYLAHRLAWLAMTGSWPERVDHKNLNPSDNRWLNLRHATRQQNRANSKAQKSSTTGLKGVKPVDNGKRFQARIRVGKEYRYLGRFGTAEEANAAYAKAAREIHGEFARW